MTEGEKAVELADENASLRKRNGELLMKNSDLDAINKKLKQ